MFYRSIFVYLVGFASAISAEEYPPEITFEISKTKGKNYLFVCDHNVNDMRQQRTYTVREGGKFTLITKYQRYINHVICSNYKDNSLYNYSKKSNSLNVTIFNVEKRTGGLWNCTILTHRNNPTVHPVVQYKDANYAAAYCFMRIHVRQTKAPQMILVNNMVLQTVRTDLSQKDVDFTAEYQYADGDVVNVTCANFLNHAPLTMAGTTSDMSTMKQLSAQNSIGFRAKLHSGHNNTYLICAQTEPNDYTKVMVRFVMLTEFNFVSIQINGMILRQKLTNALNNYYEIEYKYISNQLIKVLCEVRTNWTTKLVVMDSSDFDGKVSSYKKTELIRGQKAEMTFYLKPADDRKLLCSADYHINGTNAEQVNIHFTDGNFPIDQYPLHMELPSIGTVMELYNDDEFYKLKVIFYEFEDGETLQLKCGRLFMRSPGPILYLLLNDSDTKSKSRGCSVFKTLHVTRKDENTTIACYLIEQRGPLDQSKEDKVLREIRVILRQRVLTTTSSTTTTTTTSTTISSPESEAKIELNWTILGYCMAALGGAIFVIILILLYCACKKLDCCKGSSSRELPAVSSQAQRPHPGTMYYENLLAVFRPINNREAAEIEMQNHHHYEEIR